MSGYRLDSEFLLWEKGVEQKCPRSFVIVVIVDIFSGLRIALEKIVFRVCVEMVLRCEFFFVIFICVDVFCGKSLKFWM